MPSSARSSQRRLELLDRGGLGVDVLAGDRVLAEQGLVALQLDPAVLELGLVAHARADRLLQGDLELARIDGREESALLHHLPFGKGDRGEHAQDLRPHRHRDRRHHGAERFEHHRQVGAGRGGDADGGSRRRGLRVRRAHPRRPDRRRSPHRKRPSLPQRRRAARRPTRRADASGTRRARPGRPAPTTAMTAPSSAASGRHHAARRRQGEGSSSCGSDRMRSAKGKPREANKTRPGAPRRTDRRAAGKRHAQLSRAPSWTGVVQWA